MDTSATRRCRSSLNIVVESQPEEYIRNHKLKVGVLPCHFTHLKFGLTLLPLFENSSLQRLFGARLVVIQHRSVVSSNIGLVRMILLDLTGIK